MIVPEINKDRIAIVAVGYNKLKGLTRLLDSLNAAYYNVDNIPLIISVDASGNEELYKFVKNYVWNHGVKYVNIETKRLGLKKHIFQCASLSRYFKGVVILEDDLIVSPYFYHYCDSTMDNYGNDDRVAGIALYCNESNGFVGLPFQPYPSEYDVFASQTVCSWGEIWNERMWNNFMSWLDQWNEDFESIDMPTRIKNWARAWSKYFYSYIIKTNKFFIYPYQSLTTNFNDAGGEHGGGNISVVQVSLAQGKRQYQLGDFPELVKYDVYMHNMSIPDWLGISSEKITIDFYGLKENYNGRYVLAPFDLPYKKVKGFALSMRPWELNIKYGIKGNDIILYDKGDDDIVRPFKRKFSVPLGAYFLREFNFRLLRDYICDCYKSRVINKINKVFKHG